MMSEQSILQFNLNDTYSLSDIATTLTTAQFIRLDKPDSPGSFSLHGDTLDIYQKSGDIIVRLEFLDDKLEGIRQIEAISGVVLSSPNSYDITLISTTTLAKPSLTPSVSQAKLRQIALSRGEYIAEVPTKAQADAASKLVDELKQGDYVVHRSHGVGRVEDRETKTVAGVSREYLVIAYAEGDKLRIPYDQAFKLDRYVGAGKAAPKLTRLATKDWSRAMQNSRKSAKKLALNLFELYQKRAAQTGFAFSPDGELQQLFELDFEFTETDDQKRAIAEVKSDMEDARPMDRLLTADVGFGKTEVALRACFKAALDSKQSLVLCPTTVLAEQHGQVFRQRMEPYGVRAEVLSRLTPQTTVKSILADWTAGKVDCLIGTKRLLSKDVIAKDLGLVIVDEEQRFGVNDKEKLRALRGHLDILTLSATPIPRTLQLSLSGIRDMSTIETAPAGRSAVKVLVGAYSPQMLALALDHELKRGGQIYFVSSKIHRLNFVQQEVERVLELSGRTASIAQVYGSMKPTQIKQVMSSFNSGEIDILLATTIIESGLDNPHANTLIIEDAQNYGLAQLYQLKGRVGRSHVSAHAYFFLPPGTDLTQGAYDRLVAIEEYAELGSGLKLATRDLQIRGAGAIFGAEQSGFSYEVGFTMFASMVEQEVAELKSMMV